MTRAELLAKLNEIHGRGAADPEVDHGEADEALLTFINDDEIMDAYLRIKKWYA